MVPLIMLFAIYVQMHGEISPGGGFQAGVILAVSVILYALSFGDAAFLKIINIEDLKVFSTLGVLIYLLTGLLCMLQGGNFLEYSAILANYELFSQELGIFLVELGVGITVFSVTLILYFTFHALL